MEYDSIWDNLDSLEEFADAVSEFLHCPVTIEDRNHRLLAYSTHDERTDPARISTIIGRRVPEKVINSLWKEGIIPSLLNSRDPVRVKKMEDIGLGDRVAVSIWHKNEVLGFIWALEIDRVLGEAEFAFLKRAAQAIKNKLLPMQARRDKKRRTITGIFLEVINESFSDRRGDHRKFSPTSNQSIIVLCSRSFSVSRGYLKQRGKKDFISIKNDSAIKDYALYD